VGQNSSGKTSILQALYYLSLLTKERFDEIFTGERQPSYIVRSGEDNMSVNVQSKIDFEWYTYYSFIRPSLAQNWTPEIFLYINGVEQTIKLTGWDKCLLYPQAKQYYQAQFLEKFIAIFPDLQFSYLKLVADNLSKPAYSEEATPKLNFNGSGLATILDYIRDEDPDKFKELEDMLKRVVPSVHKLRFKRAKVPIPNDNIVHINSPEIVEVMGKEVVLDMSTGKGIPAHAISEGTMITLGLLTALMSPEKPRLILLEDVEQGLHPKAQRELISVFQEVIKANPSLQIIFSTHSPYIIDALNPSQVYVLSNCREGYTQCKRLDEHPDIEWAKQALTTGEFWDAEGEEWVNG
jgi:predicted ATPase